ADQPALRIEHGIAVLAIRPGLLAPDKQLGRPVDQAVAVGSSSGPLACARTSWRVHSPFLVCLRCRLSLARLPAFLPFRTHVFEQTFSAAFPAEAAFPV